MRTAIVIPAHNEAKTIGDLVKKIANIVAAIGVPLVAIFIVYAGFLFVVAQWFHDRFERIPDGDEFLQVELPHPSVLNKLGYSSIIKED